jgi:hypothetical protein
MYSSYRPQSHICGASCNVISHVGLVFYITIVVMEKNFYDNNNDGQWFLGL